jgi:hypothetical protein
MFVACILACMPWFHTPWVRSLAAMSHQWSSQPPVCCQEGLHVPPATAETGQGKRKEAHPLLGKEHPAKGLLRTSQHVVDTNTNAHQPHGGRGGAPLSSQCWCPNAANRHCCQHGWMLLAEGNNNHVNFHPGDSWRGAHLISVCDNCDRFKPCYCCDNISESLLCWPFLIPPHIRPLRPRNPTATVRCKLRWHAERYV